MRKRKKYQHTIKPHQHGTGTGYQYGCRCDACKKAHAQVQRSWVKTLLPREREALRKKDAERYRRRKQKKQEGG